MNDDRFMCEIELKRGHYEYLEKIAEKHGMPDVSKALRVLVNFAMHEADEEDRIFGQSRCTDC